MLDDDATAVTRPRRCDNREQCAAAGTAGAAAAAEPRAADAGLLLVLRVSPTAGLVAVGMRVGCRHSSQYDTRSHDQH